MSFDAVGIVSRNPKRSLDFYSLLGVRFKEVGGTGHFEAETESGIRLMLDSVDLMKKLNPNWQEPQGSGVVLCFKQSSPKMVDETFIRLRDAGFKVVKEPWDAFWGQRYASVEDPDGNQVDLFAVV